MRDWLSWWGLRQVPRPLFVSVMLAVPQMLHAQDPMRPWLPWRTIETARYRFHFAADLEPWTRHVAARVARIDSAVAAIVGHSVERRVEVVVDDPFGIPNGYVLPFIERPVTVWWAMPPDPRSDIGNGPFGELLAAHELAHLAHLTRPSRNPVQRQLWASLPTNLGPIARKTPRWAFEGYATAIEGQITGTGRPNNAWRPALLRQWAIEGRLPTYGQLSSWDDFAGGEFAYLGGSAFLEWLMRREGDSSLVHVWRRLSARTVRSFDAAFAGVFGESPAVLYGRHAAELTRDAMAAVGELTQVGLVEGELIQRLDWNTGDPAVSPNGQRIALTLRERDRPGRVVVWNAAPEPEDTAAIRRQIEALMRDPHDVADRRFFPQPKKAVKTLPARHGRSFQHPRWLPDNRRVLVTRWTPRGDGSVAPDLFVWDTETDVLRRVTRGAGVLHGDPAPGGGEAVAMRCHSGRCDVVRVDLARGAIATLLEGSVETSYYRPRYAPDGSRLAVASTQNGRWRIVVVDRAGRGGRFVDPEDDGANRYDAQWLGVDSLIVVSERGGIANLEVIDLASGSARALTRVTGAAVAPDVNPRDRSVWFLNLHSRGFDVRRLDARTMGDTVVSVSADRFGFAGTAGARMIELVPSTVPPSRPYGGGPRHERWLPGAYASADGLGAFVTIFSGDVVGRLNAAAVGAYGQPGTWQGGSVRAAWRYPRPSLEAGVHGFLHEPSRGRHRQPSADRLDVAAFQSVIALAGGRGGDGWRAAGRVGGSAGSITPQSDPATQFRGLGFAEIELRLLQGSGARVVTERFRVHATRGHTRGGYGRGIASVRFETSGPDLLPLELSGTFGRLTGNPHPFERFVVGGVSSPVADSSLMSQRYAMPMFPTGIALGTALLGWRAATRALGWTVFYEGASTSDDVEFLKWNRAIGVEWRFDYPPVPAAFSPRFYSRLGAAYTLDAPFRRQVRAFLEMRMEP